MFRLQPLGSRGMGLPSLPIQTQMLQIETGNDTYSSGRMRASQPIQIRRSQQQLSLDSIFQQDFPFCCVFAMSYAAAGVLVGQCAGQQGFEFWDQAELHHHQHHGIRLKSLRAQQAAPRSGAPGYSSFTCTGVSHTCLLLLPQQCLAKPVLTGHPDDK